jgi:RecJ-like exonuclease
MLSSLASEGLSKKKSVQWFHARDNYKGMSGKVVGSFCSYLRYQRFISSDMYLVGMMNVEPEIPGWGVLRSNRVKISCRVPEKLALLIQHEEKPSAPILMAEARKRVGGFGDGHSVAASGVIPAGAEEGFLDEFDRLASN